MNRAKQTILRLLREKSPAGGLELVEWSEGALRRGTIYVHLRGLEEDGFVRSFQEDIPRMVNGEVLMLRGKPLYRWLYELTGHGRKKLIDIESEENGAEIPDGWVPC